MAARRSQCNKTRRARKSKKDGRRARWSAARYSHSTIRRAPPWRPPCPINIFRASLRIESYTTFDPRSPPERFPAYERIACQIREMA